MEASDASAVVLFGSFSRTLRNSSFAIEAKARFSGDSAPGIHCDMYDVARYRRAFGLVGSSAAACLNNSTASPYLAFLNAAMPLLMSSRDFSLSQPAAPKIKMPVSIPALTEETLRMRLFSLLSSFNFRGHQTDFVDARALGDIDGARHALKIQVLVALHEDHAFGASLKNF